MSSNKVSVYEHQEQAFERFKDETEIGLFLEQGLGKSVITLRIAAHKFFKNEINALLVIAPNNVHKQWAREQIPLWLGHYNCPYEVILMGGKAGIKKTVPFREQGALHIVCVNIDTFSTPSKWQDIVSWANSRDTMIVLDEATVIKNHKAKRTQRLIYEFNDVKKRGKAIVSSIPKSKARAILTGTPVTNGPFDLWTMFEFIRPNYFKQNYYSFQNRYGLFYTLLITAGGSARTIQVQLTKAVWDEVKNMTNYNQAFSAFGITLDVFNYIHTKGEYTGPYRNAEELKKLIEPVSMFRTIDECVDMPGRIYNTRTMDMSKEQLALYKDMQDQLIAIYQDKQTTAANKVSAMIRLQQISSGFINTTPEMNEEDDVLPSPEIVWIGKSNPKLDALYDDLEAALPSGPAIIITRFSCEAARIYHDLKDKYSCSLQTGWKKVGTIEDFQEGKFQVMIANIRVISRGFNLQNAHKMFFYSNTFSLEDREQVESRIYRIGQKEKCSYTDYIFEDTVDVKIVTSLQQKKGLLDFIRSHDLEELMSNETNS